MAQDKRIEVVKVFNFNLHGKRKNCFKGSRSHRHGRMTNVIGGGDFASKYPYWQKNNFKQGNIKP